MREQATRPGHRAVSLAAKVAHLQRPGAYAGDVGQVTAIETHMAWVFLAGDEAYKLKKPVRHSFLDFSTVEARRRDCEAEVALNRALAPSVYLGVVPLTLAPLGQLELGGSGVPIDWLVRMRRLPETRRLDRLLRAGIVPGRPLEHLGDLLAHFFLRAPPVSMSPADYITRLEHEVRTTRQAFRERTYGISGSLLNAIAEALCERLSTLRDLVGRRAPRLREGHGDLRPEHVFLEEPPVVIDCIEFNRDFRRLDPVDELSYLAMECERLGEPAAGDFVLRRYAMTARDEAPRALIDLYQALRAFIRARIALWHLHDATVRDHQRWVDRGKAYLRMAAGHADVKART